MAAAGVVDVREALIPPLREPLAFRSSGSSTLGAMDSERRGRKPWLLYVCGALLAVAASSLLTFTELPWRGVVGWLLLVASLVVMALATFGGRNRRPRPE